MLHAQRQSTFILPMHPHHMIFMTDMDVCYDIRFFVVVVVVVVNCCVSGELGLHTGCMHDLTDDNRVLLGVIMSGTLHVDWRILFPAWRPGCSQPHSIGSGFVCEMRMML